MKGDQDEHIKKNCIILKCCFVYGHTEHTHNELSFYPISSIKTIVVPGCPVDQTYSVDSKIQNRWCHKSHVSVPLKWELYVPIRSNGGRIICKRIVSCDCEGHSMYRVTIVEMDAREMWKSDPSKEGSLHTLTPSLQQKGQRIEIIWSVIPWYWWWSSAFICTN